MDRCMALLAELSGRMRAYPSYQPLSEYNIFSVLDVRAKEVAMCRFLADLLDPEGAHGCGPLFLASFLQNVLPDCPMSDTLLRHTDVVTEFLIDNDRRIDIVIQNMQYFIPIEVKIGAPEQKGQCCDYSRYAQNAPLIYLTRFGNAPSEYSLKEKDGPDILPLERIRCISWSRDICGWLTGLLPGLSGPAAPLVGQYIDAIHSIADEREDRLMEQSVQAALASPAFFSAGLELERSMKQAKLALLRGVFDCFKEEMEPIAQKYGLEPERDAHYYSYEAPQHEKFYDSGYSTYPGLNYVVKRAKFQVSGLQMWFRIEVDHNLFAGIALFDSNAEPQDGYSKGYQVDVITPELIEEAAQYLDRDIIVPEDWWLTYCYPNGKHQERDYPDVPNFKTMNQCAVSLMDPQKRREYVRRTVRIFETNLLAYLL